MLTRDGDYKYFDGDGDDQRCGHGGLTSLHPKTCTMEYSMCAICDLYERWRQKYLVIIFSSARTDGKREKTHGEDVEEKLSMKEIRMGGGAVGRPIVTRVMRWSLQQSSCCVQRLATIPHCKVRG